MANQLAKDLELLFEEFVEGYDSACVMSMEADKTFPAPQAMQRAGDTFYVKQDYMVSVTTGLDISGATPTDLVERFVPITYRSPDNVLVTLDAKEMRDPDHKSKSGKAASLRLSAEIDKNIMTTVAARAGIVIKKVGAFAWDDAALADALMTSRGIAAGREKKLFLNPFDHLAAAKDLGNRAYLGDLSKSALERARVPDIGGFTTYRTDNVANLTTVVTVTGTTINGAQSLTPSSMTADVPTDTRPMVLNVTVPTARSVHSHSARLVAPAIGFTEPTDPPSAIKLQLSGRMTLQRRRSTAAPSEIVLVTSRVPPGPKPAPTTACVAEMPAGTVLRLAS